MRIRDAFVLIVGCALGFAAYRSLTPRLNPAFRPLGQTYDVVMGAVIGVFLTGGLYLARTARRDKPAEALQPGHWLLGFGLAAVLIGAAAVGAFYGWCAAVGPLGWVAKPPYWVPFDVAWAPSMPGTIHQVVGWSLTSATALAFCWVSFGRVAWRWWALFPLIALGGAVLAVGHITALTDLWGRTAALSWYARSAHVYGKLFAVCLLMIISALGRDAWEGRRGDALHWAGVTAWLIAGAMQLVVYDRYMCSPAPFPQLHRLLFMP